ncbi:MAG TPA: hypothetical protein VEK83_01400 [Gemmatimonadales bacterium]|nr:hypothetical protein [Gemmatimonadales bacterium]
MTRFVVLVALVLQAAFTRFAVAQAAAADTAADSLRRSSRLDGRWLRRLPVDDPRHALVLIPGVRLSSSDIGITPTTNLLIRGDATGRGNVYIDGALMRFETNGGAGVELAPSAIDTLSLLTGVAPASLSDAGGGVLSYETRSGGQHLAGGVRWDSDEPFSDASTVGYNRIEGNVGGPLAAGGKLTFFLSTTLQGQQSSYRGLYAAKIPAFLPAGTDTTVDQGGSPVAVPLLENEASGLRRPLDWSTARRGDVKLAYRSGASRASLTLLGGEIQQRSFPGSFALVPAVYMGRRMSTAAAIVNWQQRIGAWRGGPLTLDVNLSLVRHRDMTGPLDSSVERATRDPALGIAFERLQFAGADVLGLPVTDQLVRDLRTNSGTRGVPFFGTLPDLAQAYPTNPYGIAFGWPTSGYGGTLSDVAERRVQGRWGVTWNRSREQRIGIGVDWEHAHIASYTSSIVRLIGTDVFAANPGRLGVFTENRFVLSDAVIDLGLRYDHITPGGELPVIPAFIASSGPALWNPNGGSDDTAYANSVARVFRKARSQSVFSPRLRFAYPVGDSMDLQLGFSRTAEPPSWSNVFGHSNNDIAFTNVNDLFGRDVDFVVTTLIEAGVRYRRGPAVVAASLYRKELPRYVGRVRAFSRPTDPSNVVSINALTSLGTVPVEGVEVGLDVGQRWVQASVAYSLAHAGRDPGSLTSVSQAPITAHSGAIVISAGVPDDWQRGRSIGSIARGTNAVVLFRAQSGQTFTLQTNNGFGLITPPESFLVPTFNVAHLPWMKRLDLRISKTLRRGAGGQSWSLYLDARNLLDFANLLAAFAETGDTANSLHKLSTLGDPALPSGSANYAVLWDEANNAGALAPDKTVDLSGCAAWGSPVNCVALTRVERRFGDGNQQFTLPEQQRAFDAYYRDFFGAWRFYAPGRTIRIGMELAL